MLIVPYAAGGSSDIHARIFAQGLKKYLGQPVVVQNIPQSGSLAGHLELKKAAPDGYTLGMLAPAGLITVQHMFKEGPNASAFEPIALLIANFYMLGVSEKSGFKTLQEVIAFGKKNPKKLLMGINPGAGTHLTTILMMRAMGIEPNYVPSKSSGDRRTALAGGHLDMTVDTMASFQSMVDAKKIRVIACSSEKRIDMFGNVPTFLEQGVNFVYTGWNGIYAPAGIPKEIIRILETALTKISTDEEFVKLLKQSRHYLQVVYGDESKKFFAQEEAKYGPLFKELGLEKAN